MLQYHRQSAILKVLQADIALHQLNIDDIARNTRQHLKTDAAVAGTFLLDGQTEDRLHELQVKSDRARDKAAERLITLEDSLETVRQFKLSSFFSDYVVYVIFPRILNLFWDYIVYVIFSGIKFLRNPSWIT